MRDSYFCYLCIQTFTSKGEFEEHMDSRHSHTKVFLVDEGMANAQKENNMPSASKIIESLDRDGILDVLEED